MPGGSWFQKRFFTRWRLACLGVLLVAGAVYLPALSGLFLWDDHVLISGSAIGGGETLAQCFTKPFLIHYYRPLVSAAFFAQNRLWGYNPFFYHQTSILLHILTTGLAITLFRLAFQDRRVALLGGLIFALQPVRVGTVAWIGGLTDVLCLFWVLGFAVALIASVRAAGWKRAGFLALSALAYLLAILTKEQVIPLLLLVPLAFSAFASKPPSEHWREGWRATAPFLAAVLIYLWLWLVWGQPPEVSSVWEPEILLDSGRAVLYYTLLLLLPTARWMHTISLGAFEGLWAALAGFGILLLASWLFWRWRRTAPAAAWFLAFTGLTLLPVCLRLPLPSLVVAPYRAGVAGLGVAALLAWGFWRGLPAFRRSGVPAEAALRSDTLTPIPGALLICYLAWCGGLTFWGARQWQNALTFWKTMARHDPDSAITRLNLITALLDNYRTQEALAESQAILTRLLRPYDPLDRAAVARALSEDGHVLRRLRGMQGNYVRPETALARLYAQWGGGYLEQQEYRNALAAFQIGQAIDPGEFSVNMGLARCASQRRDYRQALHWLRLALAVRPGDALALGALGDTYAALGDWPAARAAYAAGVQNRPNVQTGFLALRLAQAQWKLGDRAGAVATLEAAERTPMRQTAAQLLDAIRARKEPSFTTVVGSS